jgi:hypothetical protein
MIVVPENGSSGSDVQAAPTRPFEMEKDYNARLGGEESPHLNEGFPIEGMGYHQPHKMIVPKTGTVRCDDSKSGRQVAAR